MSFIRPGLYFCLFSLLLPSSLKAQVVSVHHPQLKFVFEDSLLKISNYHSALQPFHIRAESFTGKAGRNFYIAPVLDASVSYQHNNTFAYRFGQGAYLACNLGRKAGLEVSAVLYEQKFPGESYSIDSLKLIPHHDRYLWGKDEHAGYLALLGNIWWKPNRWLTFTAGNDKQFIGDGHQSLLLSENASAYPFFQTKLNIWKIQYQHQVMFMRDLVYDSGDKRFPKYSSQHVISYNITPKLNVYIFEAVMWRKQDSARYRNFDVTYLNPFIFFRPVEFNQGSPDNVIMGFGGKWILFKKSFVYGQFLLDEFNLKYFSQNNGWWASKYGFQLGFKTYGLLKNKKSMLLIEYNQARPFTYSHSYSLQNYGYLREPLAHPLGSNFREMTGILRLALSNRWHVCGEGSYMRYGTDPDKLNYGSDIYKKQWSFSKYYGNYIGQGVTHTVLTGSLSLYRLLVPSWRTTAFSTISLTLHKTDHVKDWQPSIELGIKTLLYE
jgi:hypothetical protein